MRWRVVHVHGGLILSVPMCWTCFMFEGRKYHGAAKWER